jgi:hypothetical protein
LATIGFLSPPVTPAGLCLARRLTTALENLNFAPESSLESFGLPALEAGRHGLYRSSVPTELRLKLSARGNLVAPIWVAAIAQGTRQVIDMPEEERSRLIELVRQRAAALSLECYIARWFKLLASAQELSA